MINAFRHDILENFTEALNDWLIETLPELSESKSTARQPPVKPLSREKQLALVGEYHEVATRFPFHANTRTEILRVKNVGNELFRCFSRVNKCKKIMPITEVLFRTEEGPHASMAFIKAPDGNLYLQASFGNYQKISKN